MPFDAPLSAAVLLLLLPGPTNALVAAATATEGLRRLPAALGAVLAAYGLSLTLLGLAAATLSGAAPILKLLAAAVLALSAVKLWRSGPADGAAVPIARVFLITLVNPKALVLAFVVLPPGAPPPLLAGLAAAILLATAAWGLLGLVLGRLGRRWAGAEAVNKTTAAVLAAFAGAIMVTTAVAGL
ncbi:hypothetical protein [Pleomorphomonas koreensis]|uniref:hypothetical protein n=1 Tax=Pleomorphomonas koreensis TaxID=257440 RepID=UPI0003F5FB29|nr:hypothetical protein [Pleomorphomonas koreensis]